MDLFPLPLALSQFDYFLCKHWLLSRQPLFLALICFYLIATFSLRSLRLGPFRLRLPLAIWNALLALFSAIGFVRVTPVLFAVIQSRGFVYSYTQIGSVQTDPFSGFWTFLWVLSKVPELLDTVFIVLRGRPLRFMHWFHHAMSILFGTISYAGENAYLVWVVWMNFGIHTLMYSYYFAKSLNFHPPRPIAQCITTLQMVQFLIILLQLGHVFVLQNFAGIDCSISPGGFAIGLFTTSVYMILWAQFYKEQYWHPRKNE